MSYQQFPGQGGQPGMPQYPAYAVPQPRASGATAITAGVLAVIGGLFHLLAFILQLTEPGNVFAQTYSVVAFIANLVLVLVLIPGAILLFMRKAAGRILVAAGASIAILFFVTTLIWVLVEAVPAAITLTNEQTGRLLGSSSTFLLVFCIPAIATLVLALVPPTSRWINSAQPQQSGNFAQAPPGYPQAPQGW